MSQARESSKSPTPDASSEREPSRDPIDVDRFKRGTTPDIAALRDSITMERSQRRSADQEFTLARPISLDNENSESSTPSLARTSSVLSSSRPGSPTKGLGGFVESAMMKRSDSVSKRWSVKANTGLKRGDSVAGGRPTSFHVRGLSRDTVPRRDNTPSSPLASSRPGSSQGQDPPKSSSSREKAMSVEPQENLGAKPDSSSNTNELEGDTSPLARSPSKTMDPRRWSPTKSTWLESALQSEPPKPQPLKEEQPKWKVDLQRSRSRASRDMSPEKRPQKQETEKVATAALLSSSVPSPTPATQLAKTPPPRSELETALAADPKEGTETEGSRDFKGLSTDDAILNHSKPVNDGPTTNTSNPDPKATIEESKKPPALKPKPQTPPKTDFRATLKSRAAGPSQANETEPEFKAMFGKLKRTTTQNYVAPDELKNNILSGKAALNVTGGPQKTKRVDEFKESILAKKEAMKTAGSKAAARSPSPTKEDAPIPEALARRKTLSKASVPDLNTIKAGSKGVAPAPAPKPAAVSKSSDIGTQGNQRTESTAAIIPAKLAPTPQRETKPTLEKSQASEEKPTPTKIIPKTAAGDFQVGAGLPQSSQPLKPVSPAKIPDNTRSEVSMQTTSNQLPKESGITSNSGKSELPVGSKLAARLNPNLAAMLSRGSSPRPPVSRNASEDEVPAAKSSSAVPTSKDEKNAGSLTHMTKARAKGPKRRAPKADTKAHAKEITTTINEAVETDMDNKASDPGPTSQKTSIVLRELPQAQVAPISKAPIKPQIDEKTTASARVAPISKASTKPQIDEKTTESTQEEAKINTPKAKPMVINKSPELRKISSSAGTDEKMRASPKPPPASKPSWPPAPKPTSLERDVVDTTPTRSEPAPQPIKCGLDLNKTRDAEAPAKTKESKPAPPSTAKPAVSYGLGLAMGSTATIQKPVVKPRVLTPPTPNDEKKVGPLAEEIKKTIESYVGPVSKEHEKSDFDSQQFLKEARSIEESIKTLSRTINEITGDGKKSELAPQQEHILYEESMYLITHTFSQANGGRGSEVYLWCGDRVSDAAREDAQLFCRRNAREHNAKLEVIKQGKESGRLIQALGGILITRRNKNSALYMLCGRRHLGHVVFDEVDMESSSLCPGYAYLISAQYGNLYLWKGKGAGADEIGSARLIGMDLGLTGEIEEVEEGAEPASFWDALGGSGRRGEWSEDWAKRAELNGYPTVMYRVEHERPGLLGNLWGLTRSTSPSKGQNTKVKCERMEAFCQGDLESGAIHMIDAYRSIYVVATRHSEAKAGEFVTALRLAQEFAMLSPATQDRPLLPSCYVVLGDMTNDVKACFRKWSALEAQANARTDSMCVRLEDAMEALGL